MGFTEIYGRFQDFTKISEDFGISQDFTKDFKISRKISLEVYEISASGEPLGLAHSPAALCTMLHYDSTAISNCVGLQFSIMLQAV